MKCEGCHEREATVVYTYIADNQKKMMQLCSSCVLEQKDREAGQIQQVKAVVGPPREAKGTAPQELAPCPQCGLTYEAFKKGGRFGCDGCYDAFTEQLTWLMKRLHGAVSHCGKKLIERREPLDPQAELKSLRQELQDAVAAEAYEKAAELRDRIRELEGEDIAAGFEDTVPR